MLLILEVKLLEVNYFDGSDGTQNYLVFQPMYKCFKASVKGSTTYVS